MGTGAGLSAFRAFVRFVFVWICRFSLPLCVGGGGGGGTVYDCGTPWTFLLPFILISTKHSETGSLNPYVKQTNSTMINFQIN